MAMAKRQNELQSPISCFSWIWVFWSAKAASWCIILQERNFWVSIQANTTTATTSLHNAKSSQVYNPHKSKSSQSSPRKNLTCACQISEFSWSLGPWPLEIWRYLVRLRLSGAARTRCLFTPTLQSSIGLLIILSWVSIFDRIFIYSKNIYKNSWSAEAIRSPQHVFVHQ